MLLEQPLRDRRVRAREPHARQLEDLLLGPERFGAEQRAELAGGLARQGDTTLAIVVLAPERDRVGHGEVRGRVAGALALRSREERRGVRVAPAHDRAVDALLPLRPHVDEARALRRAQPLVARAGEEVRA